MTSAFLEEPEEQTAEHYGNKSGEPFIDKEVKGQNKNHVCSYHDNDLPTLTGCDECCAIGL